MTVTWGCNPIRITLDLQSCQYDWGHNSWSLSSHTSQSYGFLLVQEATCFCHRSLPPSQKWLFCTLFGHPLSNEHTVAGNVILFLIMLSHHSLTSALDMQTKSCESAVWSTIALLLQCLHLKLHHRWCRQEAHQQSIKDSILYEEKIHIINTTSKLNFLWLWSSWNQLINQGNIIKAVYMSLTERGHACTPVCVTRGD